MPGGNIRKICCAWAFTWAIAAVGSFILLKITDVLVGLRVTEAEESQGLDQSQHGESAVSDDLFEGALNGHGGGHAHSPEVLIASGS